MRKITLVNPGPKAVKKETKMAKKAIRVARKPRKNASRKRVAPPAIAHAITGRVQTRVRRAPKGKKVEVMLGRQRVSATKVRPTMYVSAAGLPYAPTGRGSRQSILSSGLRINPKRRRKAVRKNPMSSIKNIFNKQILIKAALVGAGFVVGKVVMPKLEQYTSKIPVLGTIPGVPAILLGLLGSAFIKNEKAKLIALGVTAGGVADLVADKVLPMIPGLSADAPMMGEDVIGSEDPLLEADATLLGEDIVYGDSDVM
jgi:hypothetical protein